MCALLQSNPAICATPERFSKLCETIAGYASGGGGGDGAIHQTFTQLLASYKSAFGTHWPQVFAKIDPRCATHLGLAA